MLGVDVCDFLVTLWRPFDSMICSTTLYRKLCLSRSEGTVLGTSSVFFPPDVVSGEILRFKRSPMFQEKSYVSGEILCFKRDPMFQEKSYVSGEILCFWDVLEL